MVYDAAYLGGGEVVDCTRNAAGGMMVGCVGRAFQAVYFRAASLLVLHCHAPNAAVPAAVPAEREAFRRASDGKVSAPDAIQAWLADTDGPTGWIDFKALSGEFTITTAVLAGDFNDAVGRRRTLCILLTHLILV
jgi:hypothetical protein